MGNDEFDPKVKPCRHGFHRGLGCSECTATDVLLLNQGVEPENMRLKLAVAYIALPTMMAQRDEARADLDKLRRAVAKVQKAARWLAECGPTSLDQAMRNRDDALDTLFALLPKEPTP